MLSILCVRLTIKVKVGIPESFKVGWYPPQKTGSSHLKGYFKSLFHSISGIIKLDLHFSTSTQLPIETIFSMLSVKAPSMEVLCPNTSL